MVSSKSVVLSSLLALAAADTVEDLIKEELANLSVSVDLADITSLLPQFTDNVDIPDGLDFDPDDIPSACLLATSVPLPADDVLSALQETLSPTDFSCAQVTALPESLQSRFSSYQSSLSSWIYSDTARFASITEGCPLASPISNFILTECGKDFLLPGSAETTASGSGDASSTGTSDDDDEKDDEGNAASAQTLGAAGVMALVVSGFLAVTL